MGTWTERGAALEDSDVIEGDLQTCLVDGASITLLILVTATTRCPW